MSDVKRYYIDHHDDGHLYEDGEGDVVLYSDHAAIVAKLEAHISELNIIIAEQEAKRAENAVLMLELGREYSAQLAAKDAEIERLLVDCKDWSRRCAEQRSEISEQQVEIERLKAEVNARIEDAIEEESEAHRLRTEVERLEALFQQTQGVHHSWVNIGVEARKEVERLKKALVIVCDGQQDQLQKLRAENLTLAAQVSRMRDVLSNASAIVMCRDEDEKVTVEKVEKFLALDPTATERFVKAAVELAEYALEDGASDCDVGLAYYQAKAALEKP